MNILLAVDESQHSLEAIRFLKKLPISVEKTVLYLVHVCEIKEWPDWPLVGGADTFQQKLATLRLQARAKAEELIAQRESLLCAAGFKPTSLVMEGVPGGEILTAIDRYQIDLTMVGTKGLSGMKRFLLGSVSEWIMSESPTSVLIVRKPTAPVKPRTKKMRILLAVDGSPDALKAVDFLKNLLQPEHVAITVLHVMARATGTAGDKGVKMPVSLGKTLQQMCQRQGEEVLTQAKHDLQEVGFQTHVVLDTGHAAEQIIKAAERLQPAMVVMGAKGQTGLRRLLVGSVSQKVVRHAPCSVLIVRHGSSPS